MTDHDEHEENKAGQADDPLLEEQEGKGYGEDEGGRDEELEQTNWERL